MADVLFMNTNAVYEAKGNNNKSQEWSVHTFLLDIALIVEGS